MKEKYTSIAVKEKTNEQLTQIKKKTGKSKGFVVAELVEKEVKKMKIK
jgi:predicted DNA-binding protein